MKCNINRYNSWYLRLASSYTLHSICVIILCNRISNCGYQLMAYATAWPFDCNVHFCVAWSWTAR